MQLMTTRITRIVLILVGYTQSLRKEVSYYHLIAISTFHHLLAIPEYFVVFQRISFEPRSSPIAVERFLNIGGGILAALFNLSLAFISTQLWGLSGRCIPTTKSGQLYTIHVPKLYVFWGEGFMNALLLFQYIWLDTLLAIYPWLPAREGVTAQPFKFYHFSFVRCVLLAIFTTMCLQSTIRWLNIVGDETQREWSFGQMFALASIGITLVVQWSGYALDPGTIDRTVPRYRHWCRQCRSSRIMAHAKVSG